MGIGRPRDRNRNVQILMGRDRAGQAQGEAEIGTERLTQAEAALERAVVTDRHGQVERQADRYGQTHRGADRFCQAEVDIDYVDKRNF